MMITESQIMRAVPKSDRDRVREFVSVFNGWSERFGITTPLRAAHFLAQVTHESNAFRSVVENLNYSEQALLKVFPKYFTAETAREYARHPEMIANRVYANRMGNGDESGGDGWRFRGRGLIQLTGRQNYLNYENSEFCVGKLTSHPEWLEKSPGAYKSAMWFWHANGLNVLADRDDINAVTKRVNGGYNGLSERMYYLRRYKRELGL